MLAIGVVMLLGFGTKAGCVPAARLAADGAPGRAFPCVGGAVRCHYEGGRAGLLRVIYCFIGAEFLRGTWVQTAFMALSLLTVFIGSLLAYRERRLKKRLA